MEEVVWASEEIENQISLRDCQADEVAHGRMMVSKVLYISMKDLWYPYASIRKYDDIWIVKKVILIHKKEDKAYVNAQIKHQHLLLNLVLILQEVLIMNFEHLVDEPHLEDKTLHEKATSWKSQEVVVGAHGNEDEMLPEEAEVPDHGDG